MSFIGCETSSIGKKLWDFFFSGGVSGKQGRHHFIIGYIHKIESIVLFNKSRNIEDDLRKKKVLGVNASGSPQVRRTLPPGS